MNRLAVSRTLAVLAATVAMTLCPWTAGADPHPGMSSQVAIIDSPSVINGGMLNTSGGGFGAFTFTNMPVGSVNLANLLNYDTVVLNVSSPGMGCNIDNLSAQQKADLIAFVGTGNKKLIIFDSECQPGVGVDYGWMPYPFTTVNPGPLGQTGTLTIVEDNYLSHNDPMNLHYIDALHLGQNTDAVGDMNVMTTYDARWCIDMSGTNYLDVTGPVQTYAAYPPLTSPQGLILYCGLDLDYLPSDPWLSKVWLQHLEQPFQPITDLPCIYSPVGITIAPLQAVNEVGTEHTVTATVANDLGEPQVGVLVTFDVFAGPNMGALGDCSPNADCTTDANGEVSFTYVGMATGVDSILACFDDQGVTKCSQTAIKEWTEPPIVRAPLDIKPTSCPNPLQVRSQGNVPVAFLGTADFDVMMIDPATVLLEGVMPVKWHYEDVATPFEGDTCDCHELGPDSYMDFVFHVPTPELVAAIGSWPDRTVLPLEATGMLYDGRDLLGVDCMRIQIGGPKSMAPEEAVLDVYSQSGPADPIQRIVYQIPQPGEVRLNVYDVSGRHVAELIRSVESGGTHLSQWDASAHPSGVYFLRLENGLEVVTRKVVLIR